MILQSRRKFLTTLTGIIAAPAVIRADALMRIRALPFEPYVLYVGADEHDSWMFEKWRYVGMYQESSISYLHKMVSVPSVEDDYALQPLLRALKHAYEPAA